MRSVIALLVLVVVACGAAPLLNANLATTISGSYIVVLKPQSEMTILRDSHIAALQDAIETAGDSSSVGFVYEIGNFVGFAAKLTESMLKAQLNHPDVLYIEADQVVKAVYSTQSSATWGLARVSETKNTQGSTYIYNATAGSGVDVYVIDTGIATTNVDFGGRATFVYNAITNEPSEDLNGHGTHCAGTVGGTTYGIAKKVSLKAVKVLDEAGSGSITGVVAGVNYVTKAATSSGRPSVASMSLGGGASSSLDSAVANSIAAGIVYAVAAGNEDTNACNGSPARVSTAVTVGATDNTDTRASFSNYGTCVDIFAPGVSITSDWIGTTTSTKTISGTSMATPHVAGVLALHLASTSTKLTPAQSAKWLVSVAESGVVKDPVGSPNYLLHAPAI